MEQARPITPISAVAVAAAPASAPISEVSAIAISEKECRRDIDRLINFVNSLAYFKSTIFGEMGAFTDEMKKTVIRNLRRIGLADPITRRIIDEVDVAFRDRAHDLQGYFKRLVERLGIMVEKVAVQILGEAFTFIEELKGKYANNADILRIVLEHESTLHKKLTNKIVNHYHDSLLKEYKGRYANLNTLHDRNALLREVITLFTQLVDRWVEYLDSGNRKLNFEGKFVVEYQKIDFSHMDLSGLDLRQCMFDGCCFKKVDLRRAQCNAEQFVFVTDITQAITEGELIPEILQHKQAYAKQLRAKIEAFVKELNADLAVLNSLPFFEYRAETPDFSRLPLAEFQEGMLVLMRSYRLNTFPRGHRYAYDNALDFDFSMMAKEELEVLYKELIALQQNRLTLENIYSERMSYAAQVYARLGDEKDLLIGRLEWVIHDFSPEEMKPFKAFIEETRSFYNRLKQNKREVQRRYEQEMINVHIQSIFQPEDERYGMTAVTRLGMALDIAREQDDLVVDLRHTALKKEWCESKGVDFTSVHVLLTPDQENALPECCQVQRYKRLIKAIEAENLHEVAICVRQGLSVNHFDSAGRTPFMIACFEERQTVAAFMLKFCRANVNLRSRPPHKFAGTWTPLESALLAHHYEVAKFLIEHGAEVSLMAAIVINNLSIYNNGKVTAEEINRVYLGQLPLLVAIRRGHEEMVRLLLNNGADVRLAEDESGSRTAFKEAIKGGNVEIVKLVHRYGVEITVELVRLACEQNQREVAEYLNAEAPDKIDLYSALYLHRPQHEIDQAIRGDCHTIQPDGMLPLACACLVGNLEAARAFIRRSADLYMPSGKGASRQTPLGFAVLGRQVAIVEFLICEMGVSPLAQIANSDSPFIQAVRDNAGSLLEIMLKPTQHFKVDINAQNAGGLTPLAVATRYGATEVVQLLIRNGANPFIADEAGDLPLHHAKREGNAEIVQLLTDAMLHPKNKGGRTPDAVAKAIVSPERPIKPLAEDFNRVFQQRKVKETTTRGKGYLCHCIRGENDNGYSVLGFRQRKEAFDLFLNELTEEQCEIVFPAIRQALQNRDFYNYLIQTSAIGSDILFEAVSANIDTYISEAGVFAAYLEYDIELGRVNGGWSHPSVLVLLACLQNIELHLWTLNAQDELKHYAEYIPPANAVQRVDVLMEEGSYRFNRIELDEFVEEKFHESARVLFGANETATSTTTHFRGPQAFLSPPRAPVLFDVRNDNNATYFNNRGNSKYNLKRYEEAIADCDEAIRLNPNNAGYLNRRGVSKHDLKRYEEAIKDFDEAIRLNPNNAVYFDNRGGSKQALGRYEEAIKDFDEAIRLDPNNAVPANNTTVTSAPTAPSIPEVVWRAEEPIVQGYGYICRRSAIGNLGGFNAFGIERGGNFELLKSVCHFKEVRQRLAVAVKEALRTVEAFYTYLREHHFIQETVLREHILSNLDQYANHLNIIQGYLEYDVQKGLLNSGWSHPAVLQAIAQARCVSLYVWQLDADQKLTPYRMEGELDLAEYHPDGAEERIDLLMKGENQFIEIELTPPNIEAEARLAAVHFDGPQAFLPPPHAVEVMNVNNDNNTVPNAAFNQ